MFYMKAHQICYILSKLASAFCAKQAECASSRASTMPDKCLTNLLKGNFIFYHRCLLKRKCDKYFSDYFAVILIFL
jgi:hypothetical protein